MSQDADRSDRPNLNALMLDVFCELSHRWGLKFAPEKAEGLLPLWRDTCAAIPSETWVPAAKQITRTWPDDKPAPSNVGFAVEARKLAAKYLDMPAPLPDEPRVVPLVRGAIDNLGERAFQRLGSWPLVGEVWALLWELAADEVMRGQARAGDIPEADFMVAVEQVRNGRRARPGPLERTMGA